MTASKQGNLCAVLLTILESIVRISCAESNADRTSLTSFSPLTSCTFPLVQLRRYLGAFLSSSPMKF